MISNLIAKLRRYCYCFSRTPIGMLKAALVRMRLLEHASIKLEGLNIELNRDRRVSWAIFSRICTLLRCSKFKFLAYGDQIRLKIEDWYITTPPVSLEDLTLKYYHIVFPLLRLLNLEVSYDLENYVLSLDFFPDKPKFIVKPEHIWSSIIPELYNTFAEEKYLKLLGTKKFEGTIIDVGAYIGNSSIYFALNGASKIIAFEPLSDMYTLLIENVKLNRLDKLIKCRRVAVGDRYREVYLKLPEEESYVKDRLAASVFASGSMVEKVSMVPFRVILEELDSIDLVKINCEGCEFLIFNATDTKYIRKAKTYLIQIHRFYGSENQIISKLRKAGYDIRVASASPGLLWIVAHR